MTDNRSSRIHKAHTSCRHDPVPLAGHLRNTPNTHILNQILSINLRYPFLEYHTMDPEGGSCQGAKALWRLLCRGLAKCCTTWDRIWWEKYLEIAERSWAFPAQITAPRLLYPRTNCAGQQVLGCVQAVLKVSKQSYLLARLSFSSSAQWRFVMQSIMPVNSASNISNISWPHVDAKQLLLGLHWGACKGLRSQC
jgi:hypothetical protein